MCRIGVLVVAVALSVAGSCPVHAQKLWCTVKHADSLLTKRYFSSKVDTMYIVRPQTKWTVTARANMSGATLETEGLANGAPFRSKMTADYKSTLSVGVNYLGLSLNLSLNPAKLSGRYKDFEVNLNSYSNRWGFDFAYQDARNFTGWFEGEGTERVDLPADALRMQSLNVNFYYAFNHRRFSYPAAFTQSYIQRRSAGSFLLAASGQGQRTEVNATYQTLLKVTNIGIGAGYGYNWVPGRNWLLHLSALPTFIVYSNTSLRVNDESVKLNYRFPEVIITSRGAVVRQIGNMFVGTTMVFNFTNIGDRNHLSVYHTKWLARLLVGFRF